MADSEKKTDISTGDIEVEDKGTVNVVGGDQNVTNIILNSDKPDMVAEWIKNFHREEADFQPPKRARSRKTINLDKVATLFWLGNDLMWIEDRMFRGYSPEVVLSGVKGVEKYLSDLGFDRRNVPIKLVENIKSVLQPLLAITEFTPAELGRVQTGYNKIFQMITSIKWYLSGLLEREDPDFEQQGSL
jgi:hypothetical protein